MITNAPFAQLFSNAKSDQLVVFISGKNGSGKSCFLRALHELCTRLFSIALPATDMNSFITFIEGEIDTCPPDGSMAIFLYDICDAKALDDFVNCTRFQRSETSMKYLIANKIDLEYWRKIEVAAGRNVAREQHVKFCEVSCLTGLHIDIVVDTIFMNLFPQLSSRETVQEGIRSVLAEARHIDEVLYDSVDEDSVDEDGLFTGEVDRLQSIGASIENELREQEMMLDSLDNDMEYGSSIKGKSKLDMITNALGRATAISTRVNGELYAWSVHY
jgi:hypothetical protein